MYKQEIKRNDDRGLMRYNDIKNSQQRAFSKYWVTSHW